jgi:preprotein translocase SecE subunit
MKKIINFIKNSKKEFEKVEWPSKKETLRLTGYVIGVSLSIGLLVMGLDYIFKAGLNYLIALK